MMKCYKVVFATTMLVLTLGMTASGQVVPQVLDPQQINPSLYTSSPIGPLTAPPPPPAGCPTPPNLINFAVNPTVTSDATSGLYTYTYTLGNLATSQNAIAHFAADFTPPISNVTSPTGWISTMFAGRNTIYWAAVGGDFPAGQDNGNVPLSPYDIAPGSTLGGFSFQSPNAPTGASDYVLGDAPLPTSSDGVDGEDAAEAMSDQCRQVWGNFFDMAVVGFTLAPTGTTLPVQIDILPFQSPNRIDLSSRNAIPVAILSNPGLNASLVLPQTVTFGPNHAPTIGDNHGR